MARLAASVASLCPQKVSEGTVVLWALALLVGSRVPVDSHGPLTDTPSVAKEGSREDADPEPHRSADATGWSASYVVFQCAEWNRLLNL